MESNAESSIKSPNLDNYFVQKQFEFMLESSNKKVLKELAGMQAMILKLNDEIDTLKKNLDSIRTRSPAEFAPAAQNREQQSVQAPAVNPGRNDEVKPRFGDYKPEDVPIGKFFYFGNKKT